MSPPRTKYRKTQQPPYMSDDTSAAGRAQKTPDNGVRAPVPPARNSSNSIESELKRLVSRLCDER